MSSEKSEQENPATTRFREYLKIKTVHPDPDYGEAVEFLKKQAKRIGLPCEVHGSTKAPVVVISWNGNNKSLPSIMLNSHMDVVPVYREKWTYDPFGAEKTEDGKIYGRGSQDMKSQGISYLEAVDDLIKKGFEPNRTVHIVYVPDEEIGGENGMAAFVKSGPFKKLNIGFAIDEACAGKYDFFLAFYDERANWTLEVVCTGTSGHGSFIFPDSAAEKVSIVLREFTERRSKEAAKLEGIEIPELKMAHVTAINCTIMQGGLQANVVPDSFKLTFDIRVSVDEDHEDFEQWIQGVVKKAGDGVTVNYLHKEGKRPPTKVDSTNPFWVALKKGVEKGGQKVVAIACPGCTDARYVRGVGIPAIGFSAIKNTPILLHGHDEYISENVFLEGIEVYSNIIAELASLEEVTVQ